MWSDEGVCEYVSFGSFNETATAETYTYVHTLSQHDAVPISQAATVSHGELFTRLATDSVTLGTTDSGNFFHMPGWFDSIRITYGWSRYISNFDPPIGPL